MHSYQSQTLRARAATTDPASISSGFAQVTGHLISNRVSRACVETREPSVTQIPNRTIPHTHTADTAPVRAVVLRLLSLCAALFLLKRPARSPLAFDRYHLP